MGSNDRAKSFVENESSRSLVKNQVDNSDAGSATWVVNKEDHMDSMISDRSGISRQFDGKNVIDDFSDSDEDGKP